jgi:hypothetical protein
MGRKKWRRQRTIIAVSLTALLLICAALLTVILKNRAAADPVQPESEQTEEEPFPIEFGVPEDEPAGGTADSAAQGSESQSGQDAVSPGANPDHSGDVTDRNTQDTEGIQDPGSSDDGFDAGSQNGDGNTDPREDEEHGEGETGDIELPEVP